MSEFEEYQRRRWTRENAHLYVRHDAYRYMAPGAPFYVGQDVVKYGWPHAADEPQPSIHDAELLQRPDVKADLEFEAELRRLRCDIASMRLDWELAKLAWKARKYNPDQPRVPAGNSDGGQWTSEGAQGGSPRVRLAAADKVILGGAAAARLLFETAKKVIDAYRSKELLWDMLGGQIGAVAHTEIDGQKFFGVNSGSPDNDAVDNQERKRLIDRYVELNPGRADEVRHGTMPYDAFYHAETSVLLRAARRHGGNLSGREFDVFVDKQVCNNCELILPFVGTELGNPIVRLSTAAGMSERFAMGPFIRLNADDEMDVFR